MQNNYYKKKRERNCNCVNSDKPSPLKPKACKTSNKPHIGFSISKSYTKSYSLVRHKLIFIFIETQIN